VTQQTLSDEVVRTVMTVYLFAASSLEENQHRHVLCQLMCYGVRDLFEDEMAGRQRSASEVLQALAARTQG
jgi:hypothetical protein